MSPLMLNIIIDEIIKQLRPLKKYRMGVKGINIVYYADDAATITETEDNLQCLLHAFNRAAKTKFMTTWKRPIRRKLELHGQVLASEPNLEFRRPQDIHRRNKTGILRKIVGKTLQKQTCQTDKVNKWGLKRKNAWDHHITRVGASRIVKIARGRSGPLDRRSPGRPQKRWGDKARC